MTIRADVVVGSRKDVLLVREGDRVSLTEPGTPAKAPAHGHALQPR